MTVVLISVSGLFRIKKLLLIIPLLAGCTREYECVAETIDADTGEFHSIGSPGDGSVGTSFVATVTVDWPDGEKEAEAECDEMYNNDPMLVLPPDWIDRYSCTCEKDN